EPPQLRASVVHRLSLLPHVGQTRLVRLERNQSWLDATVGWRSFVAFPERRVLLRRFLERHAGPELPHPGSESGDVPTGSLLAGAGRRWLPARRCAVAGRDR